MRSWLIAALLALGAPAARADWPMFGHDVGRTAQAPAAGSITRPVAAWRHFLGGNLSPGAVRTLDIDGDGHEDLYVAPFWCGSPGDDPGRDAVALSFRGGGTLDAPRLLFQISRDPTDPSCGSSDALADLDGDGALEAI